MIIIIEGADGTGKTTLGKELEGRLHIPLYTREATPLIGQTVESSNAQTLGALEMAVITNADVMFDRSFPSEWVYSRIKGRNSSDLQVAAMEQLVVNKGVMGIMLLYDDPVDMWGRQDVHITTDELVQANELYREYYEKSILGWMKLDAGASVNENIQKVMQMLRSCRFPIEHTFMNMAVEMSKRSSCLSRRTGAVLTSFEGHIIATGYNGAPAGCDHMQTCPRLLNSVKSGTDLDACNDVHAEENCIAQAALSGATTRGSVIFTTMSPCHRCARMLINAGVKHVYFQQRYGDDRALEMFDEVGVTWSETFN